MTSVPQATPVAAQYERFPWLDLFRLIAAMTVVIAHTRAVAIGAFGALPAGSKTMMAGLFFLVTRVGNEAVIAFFVLSGFFVGGMAAERIGRGDFRVVDYVIDRFARIMVPLVPALLFTAVVQRVQGKPINLQILTGNLLGLQGILVTVFGENAPLWSLAYEAWFYVLTGILGAMALRPRWSALLSLALILTVLVFTRLYPTYLFCWLMGVVAFWRRPARPRAMCLWGGIFLVIYSVGCIQLQTDSISVSGGTLARVTRWLPSVDAARILLSAGFALFMQQMVLRKPRSTWASSLDAAGSSGASFSYSLYLTHYPTIHLAVYAGWPTRSALDARAFGALLMLILCCIAVALLNYWLFERHTVAFRRWLKSLLSRNRCASDLAPLPHS